MAAKQFKAESKRLLDLMINSIYTHKEIFLRELISNASDALDKLYFLSLTDSSVTLKKEEYAIDIAADKEARTLTVRDNGIGMTKEELDKNLGTIAKSGSRDFKAENAGENIDIIGQFGVGFYSSFMVASKVTVKSRAMGSDEAFQWESRGADGYTLSPCEKEEVGTEVTLVLKEDTDEEHYSEYLDGFRLSSIVKKYSDYVRYPIRMMTEHQQLKEGSKDEYEPVSALEVLNSMTPIWKRDKKKVTDEEYAGFYQDKFSDYTAPAKVISSRTEGSATYTALLFIPGRTPYDFYSKSYEKGLQLYASGVLIMEKCADLLPDYFAFVKGLVDSEDLSLNISREMLQHDHQLTLIRASLERKIKSELQKMLKNEREAYEAVYKNFGLQLKMGVYMDYGAHKDTLRDLLLYYSAAEDKMVTLEEYAAAMPEGQPYLYYATGESVEKIKKLPQTELVRSKGYDILCMTDDLDEFAINMLDTQGGKEFRSVASGDLGLESEEEKEELKEKNTENKDLFELMKEALGGKVSEVRLSQRLVSHPVCLSAEGPLSIEMEKVLNAMPAADKVQAQKVLEINPDHPIFEKLKGLYGTDDERLKKYARLLYDQARLIEGLPIEDPVEFAATMCEMM